MMSNAGSRSDWFAGKWLWARRLSIVALLGVVLLIVGVATGIDALAAGALLAVPLVFWLAFIPVLHWKDRYLGEHSDGWGALLVFETSSWSKVVYWFRHVLPDWRRTGRYSDLD